MSGHEKPDAPGLWRDANEKTVVACMESGELAIRDADTGEILSAGQLEQAAPFQRTEWVGIDLTRAGFSAMPDTAGCWCDANGTLWLITGGDGIDGHIFRLKEPGREWECAPCSGITVRSSSCPTRRGAACPAAWASGRRVWFDDASRTEAGSAPLRGPVCVPSAHTFDGERKTGMAERNMNDDFVYRNQVGTAIDQLRLALKTADTGGGSGC